MTIYISKKVKLTFWMTWTVSLQKRKLTTLWHWNLLYNSCLVKMLQFFSCIMKSSFFEKNLKIMQDKEKLLLKKSQLLSSSCNDFLMISFSTSEYLASFYGTENVAIFFGQTFTLICEVEKFYSAGSFSLSSFHICPSS